ncbi:hypothetical protein DRQ53_02405 [bacterium]|nr:MAG: hypothetical protein DRQ32_01150 [bacterium]RKZ17834.1 MAG: hypothetical protein DRQ53_02405 [bacterium]
MKPRLAIFDCDGTLADSEASIVDAVAAAFGEHGLARPGREQIVAQIGLSIDEFLAAVAPDLSASRAREVLGSYRGHFTRLREERGADPLFDGMRDLLDALHSDGVLLGVATGKSRRGLLRFLQAHELLDHFATLQSADDAPSKPHPGMIVRALEETGSSADESVMIGDTSFDIEAARNAGVTGIGVDWGHHSASTLRRAGASFVARDAPSLRAHLFGNAANDHRNM